MLCDCSIVCQLTQCMGGANRAGEGNHFLFICVFFRYSKAPGKRKSQKGENLSLVQLVKRKFLIKNKIIYKFANSYALYKLKILLSWIMDNVLKILFFI